MIHSQDEKTSLSQRQLLLVIGVCIVAFAFGLVVWLNTRSYRQAELIRPIKFDFPTDKIDPNLMRIQNLEAQLTVNEMEKNQLKITLTELLKQTELNQKFFIEQLSKQNQTLVERIDQKITEEKKEVFKEVDQRLNAHSYQASLSEMEAINEEREVKNTFNNSTSDFWHRDPLSLRQPPFQGYNSVPSNQASFKKNQKMLVAIACSSEQGSKRRSLEDSIPVGESVKALLLSGVDAVCGVYSRSEPVPVKLQLLEEGHLPNKLQSKIKRGVLLGSAYGDISSERVIIRLEKLRILNLDGTYYDTAVSGFVTGEDGKYGIRGKVVDRSAKMIKNAATSGALQEISNLAQASLAKPNVNISSWAAAPQVLGGGVVGGSSRALEMLADYYIKRAEHVQPV